MPTEIKVPALGESVTELDAATGALVQVIHGSGYGFNTPVAVASNGTHVWVTSAGGDAVTELDADTGALAADASAGNAPAVTQAGRKLALDALAAATLPLPAVDPASWQALTADYAAAGTAIAAGNASGAVPRLEAGNGAISAFSAAAGKCSGPTS